ncbi:MG2 domain-containing protein [Formosa sp. PL04]|uniref:alpha-2-macroglobulin family protein n=1 Tax=Formosa sp. PL04 TaxID=3081755 RepID=UPI00298237F7|nr:MG2 domain-containing protein [Formosa sp. PL04]MDW5287790.1 carboxypeptidase-like regulatory domain-containing protein [Formosa sp. PL04]
MKFIKPLLLSLIFSNALLAQQPNIEQLWSEVETLELADLPKSALEKVILIDKIAIENNNQPQHIKSMLYKSKFAMVLEEDAQLNIINNFKSEIAKSKAPTKNILESMLANMYWSYFKQNRYQFYKRTKTAEKVDKTDFRTWDLETIFEDIQLHFQNSLADETVLKNTPIEAYSDILLEQKDSEIYRPTLYDLLNHDALKFYKSTERDITRPAYKFVLEDPKLLSPATEFSNLKLQTKDSTSLEFQALKIYQNLIAFHLKDKNPEALVSIDIERLLFVKDKAVFKDSEELLIQALQKSSKKYNNTLASAYYDFELAKIWRTQGNTYRPESSTNVRWKLKDAITLCDTVISKFPDSKIAEHCKLLKSEISSPSVAIRNELMLPTCTKSRFLITYKNTNQLDFKAVKISHNELEIFEDFYNKKDKDSFASTLKFDKTWSANLRDESDYQEHDTEIIAPEFDNGIFLIAATDPESKTIGYTTMQVSNIAIVQKENSKQIIFQAIDRNTGKPFVNTKVTINYTYNNNKKKTETKHTDTYGNINIPKNTRREYVRFNLVFNTGDDTAYFDGFHLNQFYERNNDTAKKTYKSFLFTDRSIYRPGQTVYFKGIGMQTKNGAHEVLKNEEVYVILYDANDDEVEELTLKTNEFGSVHGQFVLPSTGLNGQFYLEIDSESGNKDMESSVYFSVEDYKRPTFEANFNPITETYTINDSITVNGEALAFTGSKITNANVVYRVKRSVDLPYSYYRTQPYFYTESQEITHGETQTDDSGNFKINFKAIPDLSFDNQFLPVFRYEITADITDINGETRSASTTVSVGYHTIVAKLQIDNKLDKKAKTNQIGIHTTNLNGQFTPATGTLKIYKLQGPSHALRERPWSAPDYQDIDKATFNTLFPHDAYTNEDDTDHWEKGTLVLEETINTADGESILLNKTKRWESGKYTAYFESKDEHNQTIQDEANFELFSVDDETVSDHGLFQINTNKSTYNPEDVVELTLASAAEHLVITLEIEKDHKVYARHSITLNQNKKTIKIPVSQADLGGFAIHYSYAAFNSFKSGSMIINVPYPKTDLQIETNTFRNKIQPGAQETWSFNISGPQGEKVTSEVLASMYDASLDEFRGHSWSMYATYKPMYSSYNYWRGNTAFGTDYSRLYFNATDIYIAPQYYDALDAFGFSFTGNEWTNREYLGRIQEKKTAKYNDSIPEGQIRGTIIDTEGLPLPGVNVTVKGSSKGTQTDFDGEFTLEANTDDTIILSYIGYSTTEFDVDNKNTFVIKMVEDSQSLDEVVVTGYGTQLKKSLTGSVSSVQVVNNDIEIEETVIESLEAPAQIRGTGSVSSENQPLYIIDGVVAKTNNLDKDDILKMEVLKPNEATALYGSKGANGVIIITTKNGSAFNDVKIRKNLKETAFFFPQLQTNSDGDVSFSFTSPEALTQWKLQLLAHTPSMQSAQYTFTTVTQKELMVQPNVPRFLRQGDKITISSKIVNLSDKPLEGQAVLQLFDAVTNTPIDINLDNINAIKSFTVDANNNTQVSWQLKIPETIDIVQYKIIAKAGNFSDGEQNVIPVLSNRMLVTESLPMWVNGDETRSFTLDKLKDNTSTTLKNHKLTLEITSNPAWYAIQALPYIIEYPFDCNEQIFSRFYGNTLASHIVNSNPRIQEVFNIWKSKDALISNLEQNEELKSILIEETPWLRDAESETEQKKRIGLLFDMNTMSAKMQETQQKLERNQLTSGAWPWFAGGRENRYITQHIVTGFGHLQHLGVDTKDSENMLSRAIKFTDAEFIETYKNIAKYNAKPDYDAYHLNSIQLHYLYMRSFYSEDKPSDELQNIMNYYGSQIKSYWTKGTLYDKGLMALIAQRSGDTKTASAIIKSLKENSITSEELGMYWKANTASWYWYESPIETQSLLIEAFSEIENNTKTIDNLTKWLLKNKQTNRWSTTKSTTDAIYAILLKGSDWLSVSESLDITVGGKPIPEDKLKDTQVEAGTGYFKTTWSADEITPDLADITLTNKNAGIAWGSLYWQYFEDLDAITSAETPLQLSKKLFLKSNTDLGEELTEVTSETQLKLGDLIRVRIVLKTDRDMEFLHMKDMRASGLEPIDVISKYKWQDGLGYYQSTKDAATHFFFDRINKGIYVFEYDLRVNNAGQFSNGITTIQSMYAPEFSSHSEGAILKIE